MKKIASVAFLMQLSTCLLLGVVQELQQPPASQPPAEPADEAAEPAPPPRVVGQAGTQEELAAYEAIKATTDDNQRLALADQFLANYPDSGLTSHIYYTKAVAYRAGNDVDKFLEFGEKALEELPELPDVLADLAFYYAEKGQPIKALRRANRALQVLEAMEKPAEAGEADWTAQKFELGGTANYAIGKVNLTQSSKVPPERRQELLDKAIKHLQRALEQSPNNPYASFRLGEAHRHNNAGPEAIEAYARTVAMAGVIGQYARPVLERTYKAVHGNTEGMNAAIEEQKKVLDKALAEQQDLLASIESAASEQETESPADPAPMIQIQPPSK